MNVKKLMGRKEQQNTFLDVKKKKQQWPAENIKCLLGRWRQRQTGEAYIYCSENSRKSIYEKQWPIQNITLTHPFSPALRLQGFAGRPRAVFQRRQWDSESTVQLTWNSSKELRFKSLSSQWWRARQWSTTFFAPRPGLLRDRTNRRSLDLEVGCRLLGGFCFLSTRRCVFKLCFPARPSQDRLIFSEMYSSFWAVLTFCIFFLASLYLRTGLTYELVTSLHFSKQGLEFTSRRALLVLCALTAGLNIFFCWFHLNIRFAAPCTFLKVITGWWKSARWDVVVSHW